MKRRERAVLKLEPAYGYAHKDCKVPPPEGHAPDEVTRLTLGSSSGLRRLTLGYVQVEAPDFRVMFRLRRLTLGLCSGSGA